MGYSYFYADNASTVQEGEYASFRIRRTGDLSRQERVRYYTGNGSASSNNDYQYTSGYLYFSPHQSEREVLVKTNTDSNSEPTEYFRLYLSDPRYKSGYSYYSSYNNTRLGDSRAEGYIQDVRNDANIAISGSSAKEGERLDFTVTRSGNLNNSGYVYYRVNGGTASNGSDYDYIRASNLYFRPGETTKTISLQTKKDQLSERTESVALELYSSSSGFIRNNTKAYGYIYNMTATPTYLSVSGATAKEGEAVVFSINRSGDTSTSGYVYWRVKPGTALEGSDYQKPISRYTYFGPGETSKKVTVQTKEDSLIEGSESVLLEIYSAPNGWVRDNSLATGIISDSTQNRDIPVIDSDGGKGGSSIFGDGGNGGNSTGPVFGSGNGNSGNNNGNTTNNETTTYNVDNSVTYNVTVGSYIGGSVNNSKNTTNVSVDVSVSGSEAGDNLTGVLGQVKKELIDGGAGDDQIKGYGGGDFLIGGIGNDLVGGNFGRDTLFGGNGNDTLNGGQGGDEISGGSGSDVLRGGAGKNVISAGVNDKSSDKIYIHADSVLYGRPKDGSFADLIKDLDSSDRIYIHGASNAVLAFKDAALTDNSAKGVGIYLNGALEAVVTGGFTTQQISAITQAGFF